MSDSIIGIGFFGALTLIFVIFKLLGKLDWSWFWVFSPLIFGVAITLLFLLIVLIVVVSR